MLSLLNKARKSLGLLLALVTALALAACDAPAPSNGGPSLGSGKPVPVALLVPAGSGQASDDLLARSIQNSVQLAIADMPGVKIDLRVYNTAADPATAGAMASKAVDEGAVIILGPVYAQEANAAGLAVANRGVNVLSFSNNVDIAGGNVFVLGQTFDNTAARLASYAVSHGVTQIMVLHDQNAAGEIGAAAIERSVAAAGGIVSGTASYEFSQNGIVQAISGIASQINGSGAQGVFLTADTSGALPLVSQLLKDNGVDPTTTRFIGLTRWDIPAATLALPGIQGGWFALPDPTILDQFNARYLAAYGEPPHPIASIAYDGMAAIGALAKSGGNLSIASLTQGSGFAGVTGAFRLRADGTNERALSVAQVVDGQVSVIDAAPRSFQGAGL
jgi:outer membrane PBP1 activator LpoA protein